jgi:hypothetical protein
LLLLTSLLSHNGILPVREEGGLSDLGQAHDRHDDERGLDGSSFRYSVMSFFLRTILSALATILSALATLWIVNA